MEGTAFTEWQVDLYEYKDNHYVFHDAEVDAYDTYREAKKQTRWPSELTSRTTLSSKLEPLC
ncbi:MAG: hypothetical protein HN867_14620 [Deltaproteobacteria bacterium]|nr:hypothetical protein [Deltaproteobacteria bacterium]MBT7204695.1 hypothetical protein [Deltaproteobacteria bacterium]